MTDPRYLPLKGGSVFFFVIQVLVLIACLGYIQIIYTNNILPDKLVKETFPQTACTIVSKQLAAKGHAIHRYRADFLVNYIVNGITFESWVTGNGLDQDYFHEREPQEETLAAFDVGNAYPCWYNPKTPQIAVLVLRHDWMSTLPLAIPTIIAIIASYYILKSLFQFLGLLNRQEKKKYFND